MKRDMKSNFNIYKYERFIFEFYKYLVPIKLRKDLTPTKKMGNKFYDMGEIGKYNLWSD